MSELYIEAKHRVDYNIDLDHVNDKFRRYFLELMYCLSINNTSTDIKTYRLYFCEGNVYHGIKLDNIRFRASNKYELWFKIYQYFKNHRSYNRFGKSYYQTMYYQYILDIEFVKHYEINQTDYTAMIKTIEFELDLWENGDCIWWKEEDVEYI